MALVGGGGAGEGGGEQRKAVQSCTDELADYLWMQDTCTKLCIQHTVTCKTDSPYYMFHNRLQKVKAWQVSCHELYCFKSAVVIVIITDGIIVTIVTLITILVNAGALAASDSG